MKEAKVHSIKYNFIMNFILTSLNFLFPLITFPYVSRVLGASGNGTIAFVTSVANYFLMIASLGIPTYGIRACAKVRDNKEELSKTVHEILLINLITTMLVIFTYLVMVITIPKFAEESTLFYINGVNILLNMFGVNWFYQALEQYDYITFRSILFKTISIVLMFLLVHEKNDYIVYGAIIVFSAVASNIVNFVNLRKKIIFKRFLYYDVKRHIKPILVLFAQSLVVSIYTNLDTVMLGFMKDSTEVGLYSTAIKLKAILLSLVTSLANVLLPRMSYYIKNDMKQEFRKTIELAIDFTLLLSIPLSVFFILCSREVILILAGEEYLGAVLAMQFITLAIIPNGLTGVFGIQILTSMGEEKYVLYSVVAGAILDVVLNLMLIPNYGASGAAFATMIAEFGVLIVQLIFVKRILKYRLCDFRTLLKISLASLAPIVCVLLVKGCVENIFLILVVSAMCYFGCAILLCYIFNVSLVKSNINKYFRLIKKC